MSTLNDEEIIQLLNSEGEPAMKHLFDKYYNYMCHAVYNVLKDTVMAEDIVQDVFYEVWKKRASINISTSLKAYLRRAAVNKSLNHIRNNRVKINDNEEAVIELKQTNEDVQAQMEADELEIVVHEAVRSLPPKCMEVFKLSRFELKSYQEIADHLGISIKTVENQISKALKTLRNAVSAHKNL